MISTWPLLQPGESQCRCEIDSICDFRFQHAFGWQVSDSTELRTSSQISESHQPMGSNGHFPNEYNSPRASWKPVCLIIYNNSIDICGAFRYESLIVFRFWFENLCSLQSYTMFLNIAQVECHENWQTLHRPNVVAIRNLKTGRQSRNLWIELETSDTANDQMIANLQNYNSHKS